VNTAIIVKRAGLIFAIVALPFQELSHCECRR